MYDVSSITVVRALNDLAKDGYIVLNKGRELSWLVLASINSLNFLM